jgi:hypothetical protein
LAALFIWVDQQEGPLVALAVGRHRDRGRSGSDVLSRGRTK